ncbi:MAG: glutamate-5-semialdehyde dehydrogenase [Oscillospiraceae bacterium]|nr:glutamate-5-semialdehyde dehydrogenase [Oscillospiraceae bacterium]
MTYIEQLGSNAKAAERYIANATTKQKNDALKAIADALVENTDIILSENEKDLKQAAQNNISPVMQDRLRLTPERIRDIAGSVLKLIDLEDIIGSVEYGAVRPNGLRICKTRVPLGVIGIIFESRPNVTVDAATLCMKAGNAVILRGGKEAINSNICLAKIMRKALNDTNLPEDIIQLITDTSHECANELMRQNKYLDVLIPRGSSRLINAVLENSTVPVIQTGVGNCHVYVDSSADLEMAVNITDNAKTQRPSVCNAIESLLVHKDIAEKFLPMVKARLDEHNVTILGCPQTARILGDCVIPATDEDYATEFLDYKISVKVVNDIDEAIDHISRFTSHHSECIITNNLVNAEKFQKMIDAAAVYVNASTRFTDGGVFGFGAEIGISTQKLHARGPMGLRELTSVKYLINGNGQIR